MSKILSYKGLIENNGIDKILLSTNKGERGYRIKKFQLIGSDLTGVTQESCVKIMLTNPGTADGVVDFSDQRLLAVGFYEQNTSSSYFGDQVVIFDHKVFNQDIFISHIEGTATPPDHNVNYYVELEETKLSEHDAMVATIQNIRNLQ